MLGVFLMISGTLFAEVSQTIGKKVLSQRLTDVISLSFVNHLGFISIFALQVLFVPSSFVFSLASLPTVILRILLEILQAWLIMEALEKASRSTFGFLRVLTIPLLLFADIFILNTQITLQQYFGIAIIILTSLWIFRHNGKDRKGMWFVLGGALNAVITLSLYKYHLQHFNSVAAEQLIVASGMMVGLFLIEYFRYKKNPFTSMRKPIVLKEMFFMGAAAVMISYAFSLLAISIVTAMNRALAILWSVIFGHKFFHEDHFKEKLVGVFGFVIGIVFLAIPLHTFVGDFQRYLRLFM